jgi:hypothetical protein
VGDQRCPRRRRGCFVTPFNDPIRRDAIIQLPGGINTQLYWRTKPSSYKPLETIPENRVYISPDRAEAFTQSYLVFTRGRLISDSPTRQALKSGGRTAHVGVCGLSRHLVN